MSELESWHICYTVQWLVYSVVIYYSIATIYNPSILYRLWIVKNKQWESAVSFSANSETQSILLYLQSATNCQIEKQPS